MQEDRKIQSLKLRHRRAIDMLVANPTWKAADLARVLGIDNATVCRWMESPVFIDELNRQLLEQWKDAKRIAQDTMINLASNGDRQAAEFILKCNGYVPEQKINADLNAGINIRID